MKKEIVIDGNNFSSLDGFYEEVENKLTKDLGWDFGRNLDAFNDVLGGGFGVLEVDEAFELIWKNSSKSQTELGYPETIRYLENKLIRCHPTAIPFVKKDIEEAKKGEGNTLFQIIIEIIHRHSHIELQLE